MNPCCLRCEDEEAPVGASGVTYLSQRVMVVCATCGNKRCPSATDHRFACTNSNEPGQMGSRFGMQLLPAVVIAR